MSEVRLHVVDQAEKRWVIKMRIGDLATLKTVEPRSPRSVFGKQSLFWKLEPFFGQKHCT